NSHVLLNLEKDPADITMRDIMLMLRFDMLPVFLASLIPVLILAAMAIIMFTLPLLAFVVIPVMMYVGLRLSLVSIVRMREDGGAGTAISRSWELTLNSWWRTFLLYFVTSIVGGMFMSVWWI